VATTSREDLDIKAFRRYRVCSHHFVTGKPGALKDDANVDWLLTFAILKVSGELQQNKL